MTEFIIKPKTFSREIINNLEFIEAVLSTVETETGSLFINNTKTFTANSAISKGDPVLIRGDGKIETAKNMPILKPNKNGTFLDSDTFYEAKLTYNPNNDFYLLVYTSIYYSNVGLSVFRLMTIKVNSDSSLTFGNEIELDGWSSENFDIVYCDTPDVFVLTQHNRSVPIQIDPITLNITLGTIYGEYSNITNKIVYSPVDNRIVVSYKPVASLHTIIGTPSSSAINYHNITTIADMGDGSVQDVIYDSNSNRILIFYDGTGLGYWCVVGEISTITNTISYGTPTTIPNVFTHYFPKVAITSDRFIMFGSNQNFLVGVTGIVNPATNAVTISSPTYFEDVRYAGQNGYVYDVLYDSNKDIILLTTLFGETLYRTRQTEFITLNNVGDTVTLLTRNIVDLNIVLSTSSIKIGERESEILSLFTEFDGAGVRALCTPINSTPFIPYSFLGIAQTDFIAGDSGTVMMFGYDSNQENLVPGRYYYVGQGGELTTEKTMIPVGIALTSTKLLIRNV